MALNNNKLKIGIMGGTFDPIHCGHLDCALVAQKQYELDKIIFVPASIPNFKQNKIITEFKKRYEMCQLAIKDYANPKFYISDIESKREGISYTSDTLQLFKNIYPDDELFLIMGSDSIFSFTKWHNYQDILKMAKIISVSRKGCKDLTKSNQNFLNKYKNDIFYIQADVIDVSSTQIKEHIHNKKNINNFVTKSVANYICRNNLY